MVNLDHIENCEIVVSNAFEFELTTILTVN